MKRPSRYNTKQSDAILAYLSSLNGEHVTAGQIASHFETSDYPIGLATIYRHLDKLVENGTIRKYTLDGVSGSCYQHISSAHEHQQIHLKCEQCGAVLHLQCSVMENVPQHVYEEHAFLINPMKTVLYGKCSNCIG
ncbi:Fur family ferric uptake transcriptional regulator [Anaerotaenia torta]|uniref:Fur family transcriptional regulator n=1 Tax=Anaerotaenia torta TaxID=433293 RepID=UPI003D24A511